MNRFLKLLTTVFASALFVSAATQASSFKPVVLYDVGGKFDKSFNEAAYVGADKFSKETGVKYRDFEPSSETQYEQALKRFARRKADVIVAVGVVDVNGRVIIGISGTRMLH